MSGYRNLHREQIESTAIWDVATSPLLTNAKSSTNKSAAAVDYRIWTASADGVVRSYWVQEKTLQDKQDSVLDASALSMTCTHILLGTSQSLDDENENSKNSTTALGCTQVSVMRNYSGEDDAAGDLIVASLEMSGKVRIWILKEDEDNDLLAAGAADAKKPKEIQASKEFFVENATGTVMTLCTPRLVGSRDVSIAVGCLNGTIAQIATGYMTPQIVDSNTKSTEPKEAGTVLDIWGSQGSAVPLCIASHPSAPAWAVGRQDGQLDILTITENATNYRRHRLRLPAQDEQVPIRAIAFTPDGHFLSAGNDGGMLAIWDVSRPTATPTLAHHVLGAHASWILDIAALADSRRFITCGADRKLHVWKVDQMYQALHTFDSDQTVWALALAATNSMLDASKATVRLICGTETGWLQVLSVDG